MKEANSNIFLVSVLTITSNIPPFSNSVHHLICLYQHPSSSSKWGAGHDNQGINVDTLVHQPEVTWGAEHETADPLPEPSSDKEWVCEHDFSTLTHTVFLSPPRAIQMQKQVPLSVTGSSLNNYVNMRTQPSYSHPYLPKILSHLASFPLSSF